MPDLVQLLRELNTTIRQTYDEPMDAWGMRLTLLPDGSGWVTWGTEAMAQPFLWLRWNSGDDLTALFEAEIKRLKAMPQWEANHAS